MKTDATPIVQPAEPVTPKPKKSRRIQECDGTALPVEYLKRSFIKYIIFLEELADECRAAGDLEMAADIVKDLAKYGASAQRIISPRPLTNKAVQEMDRIAGTSIPDYSHIPDEVLGDPRGRTTQ